jgi:hypothetical protein
MKCDSLSVRDFALEERNPIVPQPFLALITPLGSDAAPSPPQIWPGPHPSDPIMLPGMPGGVKSRLHPGTPPPRPHPEPTPRGRSIRVGRWICSVDPGWSAENPRPVYPGWGSQIGGGPMYPEGPTPHRPAASARHLSPFDPPRIGAGRRRLPPFVDNGLPIVPPQPVVSGSVRHIS